MGTYSPTYINSFYNDTDLTDCGNGICDEGENCLSCAVDCISGTSGGFECGNDVCEDGETCFTCPSDCMSSGQMSGNEEEDNFCCYGGKTHPGIDDAASCNDFRCSPGGIKCDREESPLVTFCCGDGICNGEETSLTCEIDNCVELCVTVFVMNLKARTLTHAQKIVIVISTVYVTHGKRLTLAPLIVLAEIVNVTMT